MKTTPKDFFLHLGATVALYAVAIALINLAFSIINYYLPDALSGTVSPSAIAWPVSMLIVLVPLLYVIEWAVARSASRDPQKWSSWVRRWRIYLTLFLGGATMAVDLIVLINTYLNGEVTSRFIGKVLAVLIVAGLIFAYYLLDRNYESVRARMARKALAWLGILLAVLAIVGSFLIVGSPAHQRDMRFDAQRVSDLTTIQWQIIDYWQQKGMLPAALSDLDNPITNFSVPTDPVTHVPYDYSVKSGTNFDLCATFVLAASDQGVSSGVYNGPMIPAGVTGTISSDSWAHTAGLVCFNRTIDPQMYPPVPAEKVKTP